MYTALLNSHGRFMHDAFLCATGETGCSYISLLDTYCNDALLTVPSTIAGNDCWSYMQASPLEYWQMLTKSTCRTL